MAGRASIDSPWRKDLFSLYVNRRFSLQLSLSTAFIGVVLASCAILGVNTFISVKSFLRQGVRERLRDSVQIAALLVDIPAHARIQGPADEAAPEYGRIVKVLREVRNRAAGIRFVYTLRKGSDGKIRFVVDAEENPKDRSAAGDVYETRTSTMAAAFERPYQTLVEDQFYTDKWGSFLSSYAPLLDRDGNLESVLAMDISADSVLAYERHYLLLVVAASLAVCFGGVGLGFVLSGTISRPLLLLTKELTQVRNLDLETHVPVHSRITEVIEMKDAVDHMKSGLRSFRKYVPAELVTELIKLGKEAVLGAEKREMTLFFSDIADFTTISERLTPEVLSARLADYLQGMTRTVLERRGTVDKFIGDAVMAFWGAPSPAADHATLACHAALECQRFVATLDARWTSEPMLPFHTRIGLHTGEALVGNMGYEQRLSYTAIGDTVNLASRLEGLNKFYGTSILISETTRVAVQDAFVVRLLDVVVVKGKTSGMAIYELLGERDTVSAERKAFAEEFSAAVQQYRNRHFAAARDVFGRLAAAHGDRAAEILGNRCADYAAHPPAPDWDGALHMRSK